MKKSALTALTILALGIVAHAGPETYSGKEMKQVAPPPECWYNDNEWNVSLWGAYAFSGTDNNRTGVEDTDDLNDFGSYDRFLSADHAWGGGMDVKYFWHRYFGFGVEGFGLDGHSLHAQLDHGSQAVSEEFYDVDHHVVGGALGTFTLRYPIGCSRFAPYAYVGGGGVFNGSDDRPVGHDVILRVGRFADHFDNDDEGRAVVEFGGGLEVRITRHIGVIGDFNWNVVDGPHNNFGMVRSGLNFSF